MKKYVLNIDRLYTGATANALVLSQVDEDFPILIPSLDSLDGLSDFKAKWKSIHPDFNPDGEMTLDEVNGYIIDFNLNLQTKFKEKGHTELYMMDDTQYLKSDDKSFSSEKTYLHCLNGKMERTNANSSQLNVLFPYKKVSSKSLYANQLRVQAAKDVDDILERARGITLQGKASYEKCLQGVAQAGNNIYVMSPNIDIESDVHQIHGNGLTIVNGYQYPYHFPHTMTLFQPSQEHYAESTVKEFIEWYERHNRKTRITFNETYGGNVSTMKFLGPGSYEIELGTYCPTDIVVDGKYTRLTTDTFRNIRAKKDKENFYLDGVYVMNNQDNGEVGLMFNLYDTFITGNDRILKLNVPKDKDFNKLKLMFEIEFAREPGLLGDMEAQVYVNEDCEFDSENPYDGMNEVEEEISDASLSDHVMSITVRIHYSVDFGKRNTESEYREMLKKSGIILRNIRLENGVIQENAEEKATQLTFGSYVNEPGISEDEQWRRYNQFWEVSRYKKDLVYQTVVESSLKNMSTAGICYPNNYSTGDVYGDMFVTKSMLDPAYDMSMKPYHWDDELNEWTDNKKKGQMLRVDGRDYIGLGQCSNQLSLFYKRMDVAIGYEKMYDDFGNETGVDNRIVARRVVPDDNLRYQLVEVVKNINRFESSIKHKSNVFSVVIENSNLAPDDSESRNETLERYKKNLRDSVTQFVRNTCEGIVPVHTQLFDVQIT